VRAHSPPPLYRRKRRKLGLEKPIQAQKKKVLEASGNPWKIQERKLEFFFWKNPETILE